MSNALTACATQGARADGCQRGRRRLSLQKAFKQKAEFAAWLDTVRDAAEDADEEEPAAEPMDVDQQDGHKDAEQQDEQQGDEQGGGEGIEEGGGEGIDEDELEGSVSSVGAFECGRWEQLTVCTGDRQTLNRTLEFLKV